MNNKALEPALPGDGKENLDDDLENDKVNRDLAAYHNQMGVVGVRSLVLGARGK